MEAGKVIQGRYVTGADIGLIRVLLKGNPDWNRSRLSRELCERWDWRNGKGRLKDMAARTLLLKLERGGEIRLPARHSPGRPNRRGLTMPEAMAHDRTAVDADLSQLRPLQIGRLDTGDARQPFCRRTLRNNYHFIFMCKPDSHKHLYQWVELLEAGTGIHTMKLRVKNKKKH